MMKMIFHEISGHAAQRFLYGGDLDDDVAAVAIVAYHFLQAAHLAFNAAETLLIALFERGVDRDGFMAWADDAGTFGRVGVGGCFGWHRHLYPLRVLEPIYTPTPYLLSNRILCGCARKHGGP